MFAFSSLPPRTPLDHANSALTWQTHNINNANTLNPSAKPWFQNLAKQTLPCKSEQGSEHWGGWASLPTRPPPAYPAHEAARYLKKCIISYWLLTYKNDEPTTTLSNASTKSMGRRHNNPKNEPIQTLSPSPPTFVEYLKAPNLTQIVGCAINVNSFHPLSNINMSDNNGWYRESNWPIYYCCETKLNVGNPPNNFIRTTPSPLIMWPGICVVCINLSMSPLARWKCNELFYNMKITKLR